MASPTSRQAGPTSQPIIATISSIGSRPNQPVGFADIGETITLVATVTDKETAPSALTYEWSGPGTFSGAGSSVSWTAQASMPGKPSPATITLNVTETYMEGDVTQRNVSTGSYTVSVHDSSTEIFDIGDDFLTLFTHSEIPTDQVLHNFSTSCDRGRGREPGRQTTSTEPAGSTWKTSASSESAACRRWRSDSARPSSRSATRSGRTALMRRRSSGALGNHLHHRRRQRAPKRHP